MGAPRSGKQAIQGKQAARSGVCAANEHRSCAA